MERKCYRKKVNQVIAAVQLKLDTTGIIYRKWGDNQLCKPNDWIVDNSGEVYTIDNESFEKTYNRSIRQNGKWLG